jgi:RNA polymerase sigma-70 factor (ECF subfamily)
MKPSPSVVAERNRLLAAARAGDRDALGKLTECYRPYLLEVAAGVLGGRLTDGCSSVVQEAFVAAIQNLCRFKGQDSDMFLAWLTTIVRRKAIDRWWRGRRAEPLPAGSEGEELLAAADPSPRTQAANRELAAWVLGAIESLTPEQREVVRLRVFEQLHYQDIAARTGRTCDAVRQLWTRAIRALRAELGDADAS